MSTEGAPSTGAATVEARGSRVLKGSLSALLAAAVGAAVFALGVAGGGRLEMDLAEGADEYVHGLRVARSGPALPRWTDEQMTVELPVVLLGPARLILRARRPGLGPVAMTATRGGQALDTLVLGNDLGSDAGESVAVVPVPAGPAVVDFQMQGASPRFGLLLESVALEPAAPGTVVPRAQLLLPVALGAALLAVAFSLAEAGAALALLGALALLPLPLAALALRDPFAALHLAGPISVVPPLLAFTLALRRPGWLSAGALAVVALAVLLRVAAIGHPRYGFPDVAIHLRLARVVHKEGVVAAWSGIDAYQQELELGKASVGGRLRPLPYPPTFHTLAGLIPLGSTVGVMKGLAAAAQGLAIVLLGALAFRLSGQARVARAAVLLAAVFPEDLLELLRASYPAILGHLLDLSLLAFLFFRWGDLAAGRGRLALALLLAACGLSYNASPVHFGLFLPLLLVLALLPPALAPATRKGLLVGTVGGAGLALVFYGRYLVAMATDVLPASAGAMPLGDRLTLLAGDLAAIGPAYLAAAVAALALSGRRWWPQPEGRLLAAWVAYLPAIAVVFLLWPEALYYFRRFYFAWPLVVVLAATLATARRLGPAAVAALVVFSLYRISLFVEPFFLTHTGRLGHP